MVSSGDSFSKRKYDGMSDKASASASKRVRSGDVEDTQGGDEHVSQASVKTENLESSRIHVPEPSPAWKRKMEEIATYRRKHYYVQAVGSYAIKCDYLEER
jgi:hypothetical protein